MVVVVTMKMLLIKMTLKKKMLIPKMKKEGYDSTL